MSGRSSYKRIVVQRSPSCFRALPGEPSGRRAQAAGGAPGSARRRDLLSYTVFASTALASLLLATACTEPQSGIYASQWCKPQLTIDDMEDGDGALCDDRGTWAVSSHDATIDLPGGALGATPYLMDIVPSTQKTSLRGILFSGSGFVDLTGNLRPWAVLAAELNPGAVVNLNDYTTIRVRARALVRVVELRVEAITAATTESGGTACDDSYPDHWGRTTWLPANEWTVVEIAVATLRQQACAGARPDRAADLSQTRGFGFRYAPFFIDGQLTPPPEMKPRNAGEDGYSVWIDDVQLVP